MRIVTYNPHLGKYIPFSVMEGLKQEAKGKVLNIDKLITGNGATTYFLETSPPRRELRILIEPNVSVCESKRLARDENGNLKYDKGFVYLYGISPDSVRDVDVFTTHIITTTDTFRNTLLPHLESRGLLGRVEAVVLDESHKVATDSKFRKSLWDFFTTLEKLADHGASVLTITASPNIYDTEEDSRSRFKVDVQLRPDNMQNTKLVVANNDEGEIYETIKGLRDRGEKVLMFTNSSAIISNFQDDNGILRCKLIAGNKIQAAVLSTMKVEEDEDFIICSSAGYEGHDLHGDGWNIFIFSDGQSAETSASAVGVYQALGRARGGWKSATLVERVRKVEYAYGRVKKELSALDVINKVDWGGDATNLLRGKTYSVARIGAMAKTRTRDCVFYKVLNDGQDLEARVIWEQVLADHEDVIRHQLTLSHKRYADWFKQRGIEIVVEEETSRTQMRKRASVDTQINNLEANRELVMDLKLGEDSFSPRIEGKSLKSLVNSFISQYRRYYDIRNVNGDYIPNRREAILRKFIEEETLADLVQSIYNIVIDERKRKIRNTSRKSREENQKKLEAEEKNTHQRILKVIASIVNDLENINIEGNVVMNREFGVLVELSIEAIAAIYDAFDVEMVELDVRSCAWRVIYAICGVELPDNFYGSGKKNKKALNMLLNTLSCPPNMSQSRKVAWRAKKKHTLKEKGVDARVAEWVVEFACDRPSDAIYNLYTYHESIILNEIRELNLVSSMDGFIFRRHDSLIVGDGFLDWIMLCSYQYKGVGGWFEECF